MGPPEAVCMKYEIILYWSGDGDAHIAEGPELKGRLKYA
jgi:hypothetical protein